MNESDKGKIEVAIFEEFASRAELDIVPGSLKKELPPYPDLSYKIAGEGKLWIELTEACAPEFKQAINNPPDDGSSVAVWGGDVSVETIRKKIRKRYDVKEPVDLLLYTNGATAMTDGILKAFIEPVLRKGTGRFRHVWLMGDQVHLIK